MILLAILEYAILASTFTMSKVAIGFSNPLFLTGVRMVASAPILYALYLWQSKTRTDIKRADWPLFFAVGFFHIFVPFVGEFWALQYISSIKSAITYSLTPFIAALLSYVLLREHLTKKQTAGLVLGMLGLVPIFITGSDLEALAGEFMSVSLPELVLLVAVVSASYAWFLVFKLMKHGYHISQINGTAMLIGGVMSLILWWIIYGDTTPIQTGDLNSFLLWTGMLVVVANVISYNFYGWLLKHISINLMSATGFFCPIFASFYGWFFLDEDLGIYHASALLFVAIGLWLFYQDEIMKKATNDQ
jgi:drug/metabolite transporter (DMT)-like permease